MIFIFALKAYGVYGERLRDCKSYQSSTAYLFNEEVNRLHARNIWHSLTKHLVLVSVETYNISLVKQFFRTLVLMVNNCYSSFLYS